MGRRDRERVQRILEGKETPFANSVREHMRSTGVAAIRASSTSNQVKFLADSLHSGRLSPSKLRKALEDNAHKEMRKGADKIIGKGKPLTVDALLEEYRKDKEFQALATEVGLNEEWFIRLAESACQRRGA